MRKTLKGLILVLTAGILTSCGGGGGSGFTDPTGGTGITIGSLTLLVSSPQLGSSGEDTVQVTAFVRDDANRLVQGVEVTFSASSGALQVIQSVTDALGQAIAELSTSGDTVNRTITITARAGDRTATNTVQITGTTVSISGEDTLTIGDTTNLTILLTDSASRPIANKAVEISSAAANTLSANTLTTGTNGQVVVGVTATQSGDDTISASAQGATGQFSLNISADQFRLTQPPAGMEINLNTDQTITVEWLREGMPQVDETINFSATRGVLSATSAMTGDDGRASVMFSSDHAGPSLVTAFVDGGPSTSVEVEFVATIPDQLALQADRTVIGPNDGSAPELQQAKLTATVFDPNDNLVKNQTIRFSIVEDNTGGTLTNATATTNSLGQASSAYVASAASSAQEGIVIRAEVEGAPGVGAEVPLTVAAQELFIDVNTGNSIISIDPDATSYDKQWNVLVTDSAGNPVEGAIVTPRIYAVEYMKGVRQFDGAVWVPVVTARCDNEDVDRDGILDGGEDFNNDGRLTPGGPASVSAQGPTDADGTTILDVVYAEDVANWIIAELVVTAEVAGTESIAQRIFELPVLASDVNREDVAPPGNPSPYGLLPSCAISADDEVELGVLP